MLTLGLATIIVFAVLSIYLPWIAIAIVIVMQLLGAVIPGVEDVRGLSIIAMAGLLGVTRYYLSGEVKGFALVWPIAFFILFLINFLVLGTMYSNFVYLLAGAIGTYYLTIFAIRSPTQLMIIIFVTIIISILCSFVSISEFHRGTVELSGSERIYAERIHGMERSLLRDPNYFFPVIIPGLFFSLLLFFKRSSVALKIIVLIAITIMTIGVIATLSRGSVIALFSIFIILAVFQKGRSHFRGVFIVTLLFSGMVLALYFLFPNYFLLTMERFKQSTADTIRTRLIWLGINQFLNSPIWGGGLGSIYGSFGTTPHDGYTALLGDMGLSGFLLFYAMPFTMITYLRKIHNCYKWPNNKQNSLQIINVFYSFLIGMLIYNFFEPIIYSKTIFFVFAITQLFILGLKGNKSEPINALFTIFQPGKLRPFSYISKRAYFIKRRHLKRIQFLTHKKSNRLEET